MLRYQKNSYKTTDMKPRALLFTAMMGLAACQWDSPVTKHMADVNTDTLKFKYDTLKKRASDCGNKPDSTCTVARIIYPVFDNQHALNDTVRQKLISAGFNNPDKKQDTSLQKYIDNFVRSYESDNTREERLGLFYTMDLKAKVIRQDSSLTTLQIDGYIYEGGAHGASSTSFINWNTKGNKNIDLKDIFIAGYNVKLTAIADTIFRENEKLSPRDKLDGNYFFDHEKFALPQNFLITPLGLKFLYNEYEIKPYAAGQTELNIPYSKIKTILRPNSVVTQYLN